jgi:hypothetical protein
VDHDISMLVPEIWCRMQVEEREPAFLIKGGYLEPVKDFDFEGRKILASRLGYRITSLFVDRFLGRIFDAPNMVFTQEMLRPEAQDLKVFAEGVNSIADGQARVAKHYFADGSVEAACPPLRALLHIMANGAYEGMNVHDPGFREMFSRSRVTGSDWYKERLNTKQERDITLWRRHLASLETYRSSALGRNALSDLEDRFKMIRTQSARVASPAYIEELVGTIGADPFHLQMPAASSDSQVALAGHR